MSIAVCAFIIFIYNMAAQEQQATKKAAAQSPMQRLSEITAYSPSAVSMFASTF